MLCKWKEGWGEKTEGGSEQKGGEGGEVEWKWFRVCVCVRARACACARQSIFVCLSICPRAAQSAINSTSSWQHECLVVWHCVCELESGWYHQFLYWKHTGKPEPFKCYMASGVERTTSHHLTGWGLEVWFVLLGHACQSPLHVVVWPFIKKKIHPNFPWHSRPVDYCGGMRLEAWIELVKLSFFVVKRKKN